MLTKKSMDGNFVSIRKIFFGVSKVLYNSKRTFLEFYKLSIFIYKESLEWKFIGIFWLYIIQQKNPK